MPFANRAPPLLCLTVLAGCTAAADTPGPASATLWTPAAISGPGYESSPTFTPDGRTMLYLAADKDFRNYRLMQSRCENGAWGKPAPPTFAMPSPVIEADPFVTPDGKRLYYISSRHAPAKEDFDIWYVERTTEGGWGEPQRLPEPVNSPEAELLPRADAAGRLYFGSSRAGSAGGGDIYVATEVRPGEWKVENLGPPVSAGGHEYEAEISRDGRTMITVSDRGDRSHLYRFGRKAIAGSKSVAFRPILTSSRSVHWCRRKAIGYSLRSDTATVRARCSSSTWCLNQTGRGHPTAAIRRRYRRAARDLPSCCACPSARANAPGSFRRYASLPSFARVRIGQSHSPDLRYSPI